MKPWQDNCYMHARCKDCRSKMDEEWYVVKKNVWEAAWPGTHMANKHKMKGKHFLCIKCLEKRIKRPLKPSDFDMRREVNISNCSMSKLFIKRIGLKPKTCDASWLLFL